MLQLLSLAEKDRVWIRELVVYVVDDSKEERSGHSGLDVSTVRSMLGGLGKPLTSRAEELLSSVEQYQDVGTIDSLFSNTYSFCRWLAMALRICTRFLVKCPG